MNLLGRLAKPSILEVLFGIEVEAKKSEIAIEETSEEMCITQDNGFHLVDVHNTLGTAGSTIIIGAIAIAFLLCAGICCWRYRKCVPTPTPTPRPPPYDPSMFLMTEQRGRIAYSPAPSAPRITELDVSDIP